MLQVNPQKLSDNALIEQITAGKYEWFPVLSARYLPLIRSVAAKAARTETDVDDLSQEGLMALYGAVKEYDPEKASFATFAALCVRRAVTDALRASDRKHQIPQSLLSSIEEQPDLAGVRSAETEFLEKESLRDITRHIRVELSGMEYRVLADFLAGASYAQIAAANGLNEKSVNNALCRVRKKLRALQNG